MATSNMLLPLNATLFTIFPRRMRRTSVETSPGEASVPAGRVGQPHQASGQRPSRELNAAACRRWQLLRDLGVPSRPPPPPPIPPATRGLKVSRGALFLQPALPGRHGRSAPLPPLERASAPVGGPTVIGAGLSLAKWLCRAFNLCSSKSNKAWGHCSVKFCQWAS